MRLLLLPVAALFSLMLASATAWAAEVHIAPVKLSAKFEKTLNAKYGEREAKKLKSYLERSLLRSLREQGHEISRDRFADVTVVSIIVNAKPNKPTMKEMGRRPGLSYHHSFGLGGAEVVLKIKRGGQTHIVDYDWYESDIHMARYASTWSDAKTAFRRASQKLAKSL